MHLLTITLLPHPPSGKSGWPWSEKSSGFRAVTPDCLPYPKISIITPSYNQAQYLEETIRSVLLQGYPNLEYIIIDGGSIDGSQAIMHKYKAWLSHWVSEPDNGQSGAINKGWSHAKGEILAWLNSDDTYEPNTLQKVAEYFMKNQDVDMVYGDCNIINEKGHFRDKCPTMNFDLESLVCNKWFIPQQSTFIRRRVLEKIGGLKEDLHLVMDWEFWLRIALNDFKICYFSHNLANFRIWADAKTPSKMIQSSKEKLMVLDEIFQNRDFLPKIFTFKNNAYSSIYRFVGTAYYTNNRRKDALFNLLTSIRYRPYRLLEKDIIKMLVFSLIGRSWIGRFKGWYSFLSKIFRYSI